MKERNTVSAESLFGLPFQKAYERLLKKAEQPRAGEATLQTLCGRCEALVCQGRKAVWLEERSEQKGECLLSLAEALLNTPRGVYCAMRFVWFAERFGLSASLKSRAKDLESSCRIKAAGKAGNLLYIARSHWFKEPGGCSFIHKYVEKETLNGKIIKRLDFGNLCMFAYASEGARKDAYRASPEILKWLRGGGALVFSRLTSGEHCLVFNEFAVHEKLTWPEAKLSRGNFSAVPGWVTKEHFGPIADLVVTAKHRKLRRMSEWLTPAKGRKEFRSRDFLMMLSPEAYRRRKRADKKAKIAKKYDWIPVTACDIGRSFSITGRGIEAAGRFFPMNDYDDAMFTHAPGGRFALVMTRKDRGRPLYLELAGRRALAYAAARIADDFWLPLLATEIEALAAGAKTYFDAGWDRFFDSGANYYDGIRPWRRVPENLLSPPKFLSKPGNKNPRDGLSRLVRKLMRGRRSRLRYCRTLSAALPQIKAALALSETDAECLANARLPAENSFGIRVRSLFEPSKKKPLFERVTFAKGLRGGRCILPAMKPSPIRRSPLTVEVREDGLILCEQPGPRQTLREALKVTKPASELSLAELQALGLFDDLRGIVLSQWESLGLRLPRYSEWVLKKRFKNGPVPEEAKAKAREDAWPDVYLSLRGAKRRQVTEALEAVLARPYVDPNKTRDPKGTAEKLLKRMRPFELRAVGAVRAEEGALRLRVPIETADRLSRAYRLPVRFAAAPGGKSEQG
ncbi:MAG: hypothetical protein ACFWTZ_08280 [Burkholderia sp.]|jgi:hypothetical protein